MSHDAVQGNAASDGYDEEGDREGGTPEVASTGPPRPRAWRAPSAAVSRPYKQSQSPGP